MSKNNNLSELIKALKIAEIIRKKNLNLSPDQTFLKDFEKRKYGQSEIHKKMKEIVIFDLISSGVNFENILVEKTHFKESRFKPDISVLRGNSYTFFECHYHDGWNRWLSSHIYNNLDNVKSSGNKVIVCLHKHGNRKLEKYIKNNKILSSVDEVWVLDLESQNIEKIINN